MLRCLFFSVLKNVHLNFFFRPKYTPKKSFRPQRSFYFQLVLMNNRAKCMYTHVHVKHQQMKKKECKIKQREFFVSPWKKWICPNEFSIHSTIQHTLLIRNTSIKDCRKKNSRSTHLVFSHYMNILHMNNLLLEQRDEHFA